MLAFTCSHCGQKLQVKEDLAGRKAACPICKQVSRIPEAAAALASTPPSGMNPDPAPASDSPAESPPAKPPEPILPSSPTERGPSSDDTATWLSKSLSGSAASVAPAAAGQYDFLEPPEAPAELGRLGGYRVLRLLGLGGMGMVFHAEDVQLKRAVAIKVMQPDIAAKPTACERFLREAQAIAALAHEHVVTIYQVGEQRKIPFLVMQLLLGEPLESRLKREAILPVSEALRIGREIAEGLAAAHERGLIHRDIKPANIWLEGARARVKILDFGLVRGSAEDTQLTQSGIIMGTPAFMSPEQARGKEMDARSDLFSLGCVLYRACAGRLPFLGADMYSILTALAITEPEPVHTLNPSVPRAMSDLIGRLLSKNPDDRCASAREVIESIAAIETGRFGGLEATPPRGLSVPDLAPAGFLALDNRDPFAAMEVDELEVVEDEAPEDGSSSTKMGAWPLLALSRLHELVGRHLGRYELIRVVGQGHHGRVFRARDLKTGETVALKVLSPDFPQNARELDNFSQAVKLQLSLRHPNLVTLQAAGRTGPYCWLAFEFVDGENLQQLIQRSITGSTDWRFAFRVAAHLAQALHFTGQHRLIHRNVTPKNILVRGSDQVVKLSDLVLQKILKGSILARDTLDKKLETEAAYLAPEQVDSERSFVDNLCDLYSLGVVVYTLIAGRNPFQCKSVEETIEAIRSEVPEKPRKYHQSIPLDFEKVVMKMISRLQEERYQRPAELLADLEPIAKRYAIKV